MQLRENETLHQDRQEESPVRSLTKREEQILSAVATGASNAEIAQRLWISEGTLNHHLWRLYQKTGAATRAELIAWRLREMQEMGA